MKILIVDNNDSFTYNLKQLLENSNLCEYDIIKTDFIRLNKLTEYDKIMISPGPGLPKEKPILKEIILKYHESIPILGVCLGMQAIITSFGGELFNLNEPVHGIKKNIKITNEDKIYNGINGNLNVGLYHSWAASNINFPKDIIITSISEDDIIMSVKHKHSELRGIQYHPESIITENGQKLINNWLRI